jgi:curved DNA-binding protein CbpA
VTLYNILGVTPDATHYQIRAAYRRRVSEVHPDRGGDARATQEVNDAYAILSDPERRRRYDETGDAAKGTDVYEVAKGLLSSALSGLVDAETWDDPVLELRHAVRQINLECARGYSAHVDRLRMLRSRSRSFSARDGAEDFLRPVFAKRIEECERAIKACEELKEAADAALRLLASYEFCETYANWLTRQP